MRRSYIWILAAVWPTSRTRAPCDSSSRRYATVGGWSRTLRTRTVRTRQPSAQAAQHPRTGLLDLLLTAARCAGSTRETSSRAKKARSSMRSRILGGSVTCSMPTTAGRDAARPLRTQRSHQRLELRDPLELLVQFVQAQVQQSGHCHVRIGGGEPVLSCHPASCCGVPPPRSSPSSRRRRSSLRAAFGGSRSWSMRPSSPIPGSRRHKR